MTSNSWRDMNEEIITCRKCPRLVTWREEVSRTKRSAFRDWNYWGKPVPGFGDAEAKILVVGLAPGAHGSNRTGRMFTGDASGEFLYPSLYRAGFSNQPHATHRDDGLRLLNLYITALCRCVPPGNKPERGEILNCRPNLLGEITMLTHLQGIVVLGRMAFENIIQIYREIYGIQIRDHFHHGGFRKMGAGMPWLLASYHPSRQNTQTKRLTVEMFDMIWRIAKEKIK
jgi:uracil-DNA glycosylase family 4